MAELPASAFEPTSFQLDQNVAELKISEPRTSMPDNASTSSDASDPAMEKPPHQELSMVISALQNTVETNKAKVTPEPQTGDAEDLHTGLDFKSDGGNDAESLTYVPAEPVKEETVLKPLDTKSSMSSVPQQQQQHTNKEEEEENEDIAPPTPGPVPDSHVDSGRSSDDYGDMATYSANLIELSGLDLKAIRENPLYPREQERADEPVLRAIRHLFNNRFMKAKKLFERYASCDPLHALGLGSMAFFKAVMTMDDKVSKHAISVLTATYGLASAQIDAATKKSVGDSVVQYFASYYQYIKYSRGNALPASPKPATKDAIRKNNITFVPNGVLRAHVAKAEACLQIAILNLLQESVLGYIKCGLNLRRAYTSYSLVWQEYKRMGQLYNDYIDRDTVSGIQFGIGAVHLVLSTLPQKILRIVSAFGWKADKHLGFALLKLCLEGRRIRSPMASLTLLAYYTFLTSYCPQILADEFTQPAIETLLDAQRAYPNSAFFLYFAGRTSRAARNLTLSNQSFIYAIETSKNEWAEVEVAHLCSYEIGFNYMMQHNWEEAIKIFEMLRKERYWSPAIFRYLEGACLDMMGKRTEAILAYADIPQLTGSKAAGTVTMEQYIVRKINSLQASGYQDMDMTLCALEYLCLFNAFSFMDAPLLEQNLKKADHALAQILEAEKIEYDIRTQELLPETPPPQYFDQRGTLLLIKACIQNAMGHYRDSIIHLNWIIDHKDMIVHDKWIVPFAFWEAGVTSWGLGNKVRARYFWETALGFTKYDFEYRLAVRVNLAITKAEELGVVLPDKENQKQPHSPKQEMMSSKASLPEAETRLSSDSVTSPTPGMSSNTMRKQFLHT